MARESVTRPKDQSNAEFSAGVARRAPGTRRGAGAVCFALALLLLGAVSADAQEWWSRVLPHNQHRICVHRNHFFIVRGNACKQGRVATVRDAFSIMIGKAP